MDSESPYLPVQGAGDSKEVARSTWIKSLNYYFDLWFSRSVGRFSDWPGFLSKTLHHVAPRMVPKPSFRSCHKRRLISTGTGELHLWIVSAAGAESLNAQRWTQSPDLCSYNWNPGTRSLFFFFPCKLCCSWMFSWVMKASYEDWFQVTLLLTLSASSPEEKNKTDPKMNWPPCW